jgi:hypothetical protein
MNGVQWRPPVIQGPCFIRLNKIPFNFLANPCSDTRGVTRSGVTRGNRLIPARSPCQDDGMGFGQAIGFGSDDNLTA